MGNYKKIHLSKSKKRIVFVIMRYCEYQIEEGKQIAYTLLNGKTRGLANEKDENYMLLAVCQLREVKKMPIWCKNDVDQLKKCKPNITNGVSGYTHCESSGKYYSFGNRANFRVKNGQSLTQYVCKTSKMK